MAWYGVIPLLVFFAVLTVLIVTALVVIPVVLVLRRRRDAEITVVPVGAGERS
jgi:hypothetical protein